MRDNRFPEFPDGRSGSPANGHPRNGAPRNGAGPAFTRVLTADDGADAPVDLVAVQADDELVSTIGARPAGAPAPDYTAASPFGRDTDDRDTAGEVRDDRLVAMLAAWRAEIDADPIPELVDLDAAVAAVLAGVQADDELASRRRRAGRMRHLAPLAAAAAIIVATVSGVGLGSQNAVPGDTLWPIQKVVNPERAESVEARVEVETRLQKVRTALAQGDTATAERELQAIRTQIPAVRGQEGQPQLAQEQEFLAAKLIDTPPGTPADLTTPPKSNPAARSTGTTAAPPASGGVPPAAPAPAATAPPASQSVTDPKPTDPDPRPGPVDRGSAPVVPAEPGGTRAPLPKPSPPEPDVTKAPEVPDPDRLPDSPGPDSGGGGGTEGGGDPSTGPGPVKPVPQSGANEVPGTGEGEQPGPSSDTTTASGSAGAATATDPTS